MEPKEPSAIESESLSAERRCAGRSLCESSTLALPDPPLTASGKKVSRPVSSETRRKAWWGRAVLASSLRVNVSLRVSRAESVRGDVSGLVAEKLCERVVVSFLL